MSDPVLGANLLRARTARSLTQADVARRAGISRVAYRAIEGGISNPRVDTVRKLALAVGVDVQDLLKPVPELTAVRFRASRGMKNRGQVVANVARWLEAYAELETLLGRPKAFVLEALTREFGRSKRSRRSAEAATAARKALGLGEDEAIRDVCGLLEDRAGVKVYPYIVARDDFFGLSLADHRFGHAVVVNVWERITVERWIFTAVHELGHLLLHRDAFDVKRSSENPREESEADDFAGAFLKPKKVFAKEWNDTAGMPFVDRVLKVKSIFNVSWKSVLRSAYAGTKRQDHVFRHEYQQRTGQLLGARDEPYRLPHTFFMTDRLDRLVRDAVARKLITQERGAEILGIDMAEMRGRVALWEVT